MSTAALQALITMFILCIVGLVLRKIGFLKDAFISDLNRLLVYVASPAIMINATQSVSGNNVVRSFIIIVLFAVVVMSLVMLCVKLSTRHKYGMDANVMATASALGNVGFMGRPLIASILGQGSVLYVSAFCMGFSIVQWTVGSWIYGSDGKQSNGLSQFYLTAFSLISFFMVLLRVKLPQFAFDTLQYLSNLNTPIAMIIIGARMENLIWRDIQDIKVWYVVLAKLLIFPIIGILLTSILPIETLPKQVIMLCCAMPSGASVQIQVELYHGNAGLATKCIAVTTLLSMITVSLLCTFVL